MDGSIVIGRFSLTCRSRTPKDRKSRLESRSTASKNRVVGLVEAMELAARYPDPDPDPSEMPLAVGHTRCPRLVPFCAGPLVEAWTDEKIVDYDWKQHRHAQHCPYDGFGMPCGFGPATFATTEEWSRHVKGHRAALIAWEMLELEAVKALVRVEADGSETDIKAWTAKRP